MSHLQAVIESWLDNHDVTDRKIHKNKETGYSSSSFHGSLTEETYELYMDCHDGSETLKVYAYAPFLIPEEKMKAAFELIACVNRSVLRIGNIDLDTEAGWFRWRLGMLTADIEVTETMVHNMIVEAISAMDHVCPMVQRYLDGDSILDAIQAAEEDDAVTLQ